MVVAVLLFGIAGRCGEIYYFTIRSCREKLAIGEPDGTSFFISSGRNVCLNQSLGCYDSCAGLLKGFLVVCDKNSSFEID